MDGWHDVRQNKRIEDLEAKAVKITPSTEDPVVENMEEGEIWLKYSVEE